MVPFRVQLIEGYCNDKASFVGSVRALWSLGLRSMIRGTLGDRDPLKKVPFKRARSRVKKGPL